MADRPYKKLAAKKSAAEKKAEKERAEEEARRRVTTFRSADTIVDYRSTESSEATTESLYLSSEAQEPEMTSFRTGIPEPGKESPLKPGEASASTSRLQSIAELEDEPSRGKLSPGGKQMAAASAGEGTSTASRRPEQADVESSSEFKEKDADKSKSGGKTVISKRKPLQRQTAVSFKDQPPASDPGKAEISSEVVSSTTKSGKSPSKGKKGIFSRSTGKQDVVTTSKPSEGPSLGVEEELKETETREEAAGSPSPRKGRWGIGKRSPGKKQMPPAGSGSSSLVPDPVKELEAAGSPSPRKGRWGIGKRSPGKKQMPPAGSGSSSLVSDPVKELEAEGSPSPRKGRWGIRKKSPSKKQTAPAGSGSSSLVPDPAEKSPAKREKHKMALRSRSPKQGAAAAASLRPQPSSSGSSPSGSRHSSESAASDLAKHLKKGAFAVLRHQKASDEMPLVEESMETSESEKIVWKTCKSAAKRADVRKQVEPSPDKEGHRESEQRRMRMMADTVVGQSTIDSTVAELSTDVSMVSSDSSIHGGSELIEESTSSSGTQSRAEVTSGFRKVRISRKPLQGQKRVNVESKDSDEETRAFAAIGSPMKKVPPPVREEEEEEDSDEE